MQRVQEQRGCLTLRKWALRGYKGVVEEASLWRRAVRFDRCGTTWTGFKEGDAHSFNAISFGMVSRSAADPLRRSASAVNFDRLAVAGDGVMCKSSTLCQS